MQRQQLARRARGHGNCGRQRPRISASSAARRDIYKPANVRLGFEPAAQRWRGRAAGLRPPARSSRAGTKRAVRRWRRHRAIAASGRRRRGPRKVCGKSRSSARELRCVLAAVRPVRAQIRRRFGGDVVSTRGGAEPSHPSMSGAVRCSTRDRRTTCGPGLIDKIGRRCRRGARHRRVKAHGFFDRGKRAAPPNVRGRTVLEHLQIDVAMPRIHYAATGSVSSAAMKARTRRPKLKDRQRVYRRLTRPRGMLARLRMPVKLPGPVVTAMRSSLSEVEAALLHHARDERHQRFGVAARIGRRRSRATIVPEIGVRARPPNKPQARYRWRGFCMQASFNTARAPMRAAIKSAGSPTEKLRYEIASAGPGRTLAVHRNGSCRRRAASGAGALHLREEHAMPSPASP